MVSPAGKRKVVGDLRSAYDFSERRSCRLVGLSRTSYSYQAVKSSDEALKKRLHELASLYPSYGYLMLHALLKREGLVVNKKRTYRLYVEGRLQVRIKKRKRLVRMRSKLTIPSRVNQRWSMDFVHDQLNTGRRLRILNIIDDYSRECVGQVVDYSIGSQQVVRLLEQLIIERGKPEEIVCDNGPEFTSKIMSFWSRDNEVKLRFIEPGKPTQNAYVESFNGKFRNNCLNQHWFRSLEEARQIIEPWRYHYNHERPHSSLGYLTPAAFSNRIV